MSDIQKFCRDIEHIFETCLKKDYLPTALRALDLYGKVRGYYRKPTSNHFPDFETLSDKELLELIKSIEAGIQKRS